MTTSIETLEFQSEARQLLQLMIHSIYSNKDVFLRELVSNASDALDKLRLETYRDKELEADVSDLHVELETDRVARTLTVRDNGIGMSRDEVVSLIGTIAKSGTAELLAKLRETKDAAASADLIGQFGVGFYATFMVADKVTLVTRRAGAAEGVRWESSGEGTYTIEAAADAPQGTVVTLHLKPEDTEDNLHDYADPAKVRQIIKHYSDFITWPIRMAKPADHSAGDTAGDGADDSTDDSAGDTELETVNSMKALWARSASDVSEDELTEFYRHVSHDWNPPLETVRLQAEGTFEYQALLFVPSRAPFDLFMREAKRGVQLYVKRVFIMDDCEALVPEYLRFVKGVVDAQDLSLNVSREILQQDRQIQLIRKRLVRKVLSALKALPAEKYTTFWGEFGKVMKEGLVGDPDNRDAILGLCSFRSTHDADKQTTLHDYVERMKDNQQDIYYLTGESRTSIENSPHMEAFQAKGFEVLVLTDPIDEMWVDSVPSFEGKEFHSIAKGQVDLEDAADKEAAETERAKREQEFAPLLEWMRTTLADTVKEVRLSSRLTTSPACIVGDEHDITPTLEKMYRAMGQELPPVKRILELNPGHPLITGLRTAHETHADDPELADTVHVVHDMAVLAEGGELADPARFVKLVAKRLEHVL